MPAPLFVLGLTLAGQGLVAFNSPWWEQYDVKEKYLCSDRAVLLIERNESQASLFARGMRSTLFRDTSSSSSVVFRNDVFKVLLRGDELTLDQSNVDPFNPRLTCVRTDDA